MLQRSIRAWSRSRYAVPVKWIALLGIVLVTISLVNLHDVIASTARVSLLSLVAFLTLTLASRLLYAVRWRLICASGVGLQNVSTLYLLRVSLLGEFVGIAAPSSLGAEAVRLLKLTACTENGTRAVASIAGDRLIGLASMFLLAVVFLPNLGAALAWNLPGWSAYLPGGVVLALAGLGTVGLWLRRRGVRLPLPPALQFLDLHAGWLLASTALSLAGHLIVAVAYYLVIREIQPLPMLTVIALVLTSQLACSVPISVLGIGLGDGSLIAVGTLAGMRPETVLAATVISLFSRYLFAIAGVLLEMVCDGRSLLRSALSRNNSCEETPS